MVARRLVRCTCGPGRCCRTSGPGGRKRWVTTTAGTAWRSGSTGIVTITIGSRTCRYPLPWAVTVDDSPRPKIRDGQGKDAWLDEADGAAHGAVLVRAVCGDRVVVRGDAGPLAEAAGGPVRAQA